MDSSDSRYFLTRNPRSGGKGLMSCNSMDKLIPPSDERHGRFWSWPIFRYPQYRWPLKQLGVSKQVLIFWFSNSTSGKAAVNTLTSWRAIYRKHCLYSSNKNSNTSWLMRKGWITFTLSIGPSCRQRDYKKQRKTHKRAPRGRWGDKMNFFFVTCSTPSTSLALFQYAGASAF